MQPSSIAIGVSQQPPPLQLLLLGLQYAFMVCVYMVIVVIVVHAAGASSETARSAVSLAMIASAIGTALQALHRGPVGSGFLAPPVFSAIYLGPSILAAKAGGLSAVACMTVCAGLTEIVVAALLLHLRIILQPAITGLTITIIALELGIVGLQHALDVGGQSSARFLDHVAVSALTFFVCVGFTIWGRGVWKLICTLTGLVAGVATALLVGLFDEQTLKSIAAAPWIAIPDPFYISFSTHVSLMPAFMAAGLAAAIRTVGVVTTCQKANDVELESAKLPQHTKGRFRGRVGLRHRRRCGGPRNEHRTEPRGRFDSHGCYVSGRRFRLFGGVDRSRLRAKGRRYTPSIAAFRGGCAAGIYRINNANERPAAHGCPPVGCALYLCNWRRFAVSAYATCFATTSTTCLDCT